MLGGGALLSTFLQLSSLSCKDRVQCKVRLDPKKERDKLVTISKIHVRIVSPVCDWSVDKSAGPSIIFQWALWPCDEKFVQVIGMFPSVLSKVLKK